MTFFQLPLPLFASSMNTLENQLKDFWDAMENWQINPQQLEGNLKRHLKHQ